VKSLEDLRPYLVYEIEIFYRIQSLRGRKFKSVALSGPGKSRELINSGMDAFKKQNSRGTEQV
jgi:hypothetical protein